jgi:hypothetical protein
MNLDRSFAGVGKSIDQECLRGYTTALTIKKTSLGKRSSITTSGAIAEALEPLAEAGGYLQLIMCRWEFSHADYRARWSDRFRRGPESGSLAWSPSLLR